MTDKVQKIRKEVEKRYECWKEKESNSHSIESEIRMSECRHLLLMLDSLQEEPVSEDLEIAANEWDTKASFTPFYMTLDDKGNPNGVRQDYTTHAESFKAGAKWQKEKEYTCYEEAFEDGAKWKIEQMMANAIDGYVIEDIEEGNGDFLLSAEYLPKSMGLKDQQKVKVIVIRED